MLNFMPKKIYDIRPPKLVAKASGVKVAGATKRKPRAHKSVQRKSETRFPLREILIGGGVIVLLLAAFGAAKLPKADILISPKTEILSLQETMKADKAVGMVNMTTKTIPARTVAAEASGSEQFPSTGSAADGGLATGTITIFNKITPKVPFTLKVGTHFLSDSGKSFVTLQKVTIPAGGSIDAKVQAQEAGSDYNVGASKFSVPKLSGTSYYYSIYGSSKSPMTGGYAGTVKKVTQDDIDSAKDTLVATLFDQAQASLQGKLSADDMVLEDAAVQHIVSSAADAKVGAVADNFTVTAKVEISAVVFSKKDVEQFAMNAINAQMQSSQSYLPESLGVDYSINSVDTKAGSISMALKISAKTYQSIDTASMARLSAGKSSQQIIDNINQAIGDQVQAIQVKFWPFWVKKAPTDTERVHASLNFE